MLQLFEEEVHTIEWIERGNLVKELESVSLSEIALIRVGSMHACKMVMKS